MTVAAIVPARNESARIQDTVRALRTIETIDRVIVVDDASNDDTTERAGAAGAEVVRLPTNRGKGGALIAGLGLTDADVVVFIDGDLGTTAAIARDLLGPVLAGNADMTIGAPPPNGTSGFGIVESVARAGIRALTGRSMTRPLSGQRAVRRVLLDRVVMERGFGVETALTIDALRAGYGVLEVPVSFEHARTGRDLGGFVHRARQGLHVVKALVPRLGRRRVHP
jgi:glycosyltransferase involved in cell wall biosynthesis